ncbi:MAG TPA: SDR family oxidoreductase [Acidimicrobiales bacterium]|jgi:NAD(P)-dependent dehydrogenase (short-subunit alcohol dehydrogenase family)
MTTNTSVAVVTGANSGIGRAIAIHLAAQGQTVYGTVRSVDKAAKLNAMAAQAGVEVNLVELDVADDASVRSGLGQVLDAAGRVDVLVNNAGVGGNGVVEETTISSFAEVMNVNFYGALRCLQAVLPGMRERGAGTIVNVTSVVGRFAALAQAPYVASKWALEGASEELAQELAAFGIRVAIIEPGITKSAIFAKNLDATSEGSPYESHLRRMFQFYAAGHPHATDPFEVAEVVHHAITTDTPVLRYPVSWGGPEVLGRRPHITDEQWIALGAIPDDNDYYRAFTTLFGLDITPPT